MVTVFSRASKIRTPTYEEVYKIASGHLTKLGGEKSAKSRNAQVQYKWEPLMLEAKLNPNALRLREFRVIANAVSLLIYELGELREEATDDEGEESEDDQETLQNEHEKEDKDEEGEGGNGDEEREGENGDKEKEEGEGEERGEEADERRKEDVFVDESPEESGHPEDDEDIEPGEGAQVFPEQFEVEGTETNIQRELGLSDYLPQVISECLAV